MPDNNLACYIHGSHELIEQGVDEEGRKFYKIYYNDYSDPMWFFVSFGE